LGKLFEVHRLRHKSTRQKSADARDILQAVRVRQHHDWYIAQTGIAPEFGEHLSSVLLGEIEIQKNQHWTRASVVRGFPAKKRQCLLTVASDVKASGRFHFVEGLANEPDLSGMIFDQKNIERGLGEFSRGHTN
jgi:hypothetical protein